MIGLVLAQKLLLSVYDESRMHGKPSGAAAEMAGIPGSIRQSCSVRGMNDPWLWCEAMVYEHMRSVWELAPVFCSMLAWSST